MLANLLLLFRMLMQIYSKNIFLEYFFLGITSSFVTI